KFRLKSEFLDDLNVISSSYLNNEMSNTHENPELEKAMGIEGDEKVSLTRTYRTLETPPRSQETGYMRMPDLVEVRIDGTVGAGPLHLKRTVYADTEENRWNRKALNPVEGQRGLLSGYIGDGDMPLDPGTANRLWEKYSHKATEFRQ
ncbi:MAG: hypothetical protein HY397_01305, partial [Candidatus Doudnabacteria bacterium]|nr:hypothetical protein [Candidatus Doudnabacteria bacterium]